MMMMMMMMSLKKCISNAASTIARDASFGLESNTSRNAEENDSSSSSSSVVVVVVVRGMTRETNARVCVLSALF